MNETCTRWQDWIESDAEPSEVMRDAHLGTCSSCREQWTTHQILTGLAHLPRPALSPDLEGRVRRAIVDLAPAGVLSPRARGFMRVYWLLATFAAGVILSQLGTVSTAWIVFWIFLFVLGSASLPVFGILRRRSSWGLMDLLVWTFR